MIDSLILTFLPFAAAGCEWIKTDQQDGLSKAQPSFRPAGFHLFAAGDPAKQGKASGAFFCLLFCRTTKE